MSSWDELDKTGKAVIKGTTQKINTNARQSVKKAANWLEEIAAKRALRKLGKGLGKGLKAVPLIGGIASALMTNDASAAVPILGDVELLGPEKGTLDYKLESGEQLTPEEYKILEERSKKAREKFSSLRNNFKKSE